MIGLEYILGLYNMQQLELAEQLGIKKQNINLWIKGKQNIPKKYLPTLEKLFHVDRSYFSKELSEIEKLEIQKEKLKNELKPIIKSHEQVLRKGGGGLEDVPVYDKEEINAIERSIEKARLSFSVLKRNIGGCGQASLYGHLSNDYRTSGAGQFGNDSP
ncbi:YdaS family helix-turn-helix protein [Terrilactibacillus sp. S3-3]|nr:YdaS family helix-turn-helix protein [Terrilactibacillus sp. S3-3]